MKIESIDISHITPYKKNAKLHPREQIEQIKKSIQMYGNNDPIAVWGEDNVIVEGHGRYMALCELGYKTADIIRLDHLTDEQRREYMLVHNQTTMNSGWDIDLLDEELEGLDFDGFDFGFEPEEEEEGDEQEAQDDDYEPEPPEEPKAKRGDIYKLGRHRLMCGDSTSVTDVEALCGGRKMDLLITDPPYNVDYTGKTKDALKIENDKMEDESFRLFLRDAFLTADTVMKPGATFYIWHADSEGYNFRGACHDIEWKVRQCLIWVKNVMVMGRQDYQWKHEPCLYGWKEGASHNWYSDRKQTTLLEFDRPSRSELHPTMKPVPLFDYQIKNSSKKGDAVLDLFGGSGTTMVACEQDGRTAYLMELDPRYVDVIIDRWEKLTGQKAELLTKEDA